MYVATRQFHCGRDGFGVNQHIVKGLQSGTQSDQDLFRGLTARFIYGDPVESPHQRTILFKALVVFFPGGVGYYFQQALGYGWFQHVGHVQGALAGAAGTLDGVCFVNEQHTVFLGF